MNRFEWRSRRVIPTEYMLRYAKSTHKLPPVQVEGSLKQRTKVDPGHSPIKYPL